MVNKPKNTLDISAFGLFLLSLFIFFLALREKGILMLIGITSAVILFMVEGYFILQKIFRYLNKKNQ